MQNSEVTNKEHYGMLWYFPEWSILHGLLARAPLCHISLRPLQKINVRPCLHGVGDPGQVGRIHHPRKRVLDEICCLDSSTLNAG